MAGDAYIRIAVDVNGDKIVSAGAALESVIISADKAGASFAKIAGQSAAADAGIARVGNATAAARVEMGALTGSTGMMMGGLARMAGQSQALAPLINEAFSAFAVVAFVDVVEGAIERIDKAKDSVAGIGKEWLVASSATREHSAALEIETLKLSDEISMIEGRPKKNMLAIALREADAEAEKLYGTLSADVDKQLELLETKGVGLFNAMATGTESTNAVTDAMKAPMLQLSTALQKQRATYAETSAEIAGDADAQAKARAKAARDAADAEVEATRRAALAQIESLQQTEAMEKKASIVREQRSQAIGPAMAFGKSEAEATRMANQGYAAQENILASLHTSLIEIGKAQQEIKGVAPLKAHLAGDEGQKDTAELARASGDAKIEAQKKTALAWMDSVEAMAKAELEMGEITATEEINQRREMENEKLQIQADALNAQIAMIAKNPSPDKTKDATKTSALNSDLESLQAAHVGKMASLDAEYGKAQEASLDAASEAGLKFMDDQQKAAEEKMQAKLRVDEKAVSAAERIASTQLMVSRNADDEALRTHTISLRQWAQVSAASIDQWAASQKPAIQRAMQDVQAAIKAETDPKALDQLKEKYQALVDTLNELDQKRLQDIQKVNLEAEQRYVQSFQRIGEKMASAINGPLNTAIGAMLNGSERASIAFARMGSTILTSGVNAVVSWAVKTGEQILVVEILEHSSLARRIVAHTAAMTAKLSAETASLTAEIAQMSAGAAAKQAVTSTTNSAQTISFAGVSAAAAIASAFETVPFPANLAVAPAAGAAALAEVMAYLPMASMERGGIMGDSPTMTLLHPREMVLPERISQSVQRMAAGGGSGSSSGGDQHFHITHAPQINAIDQRGMDAVMERQSDNFVRMLQRAVRNGKLTFGR